MIILYTKEDYGKYKKGDILAFHSALKDLTGKAIEVSKSAFSDLTFKKLQVPKNKTESIILPDNQNVMDRYWEYRFDFINKKIEKKIKPILKITTDAKDTISPYDGYPDIPADGKSIANIYIQKVLPGGTPCKTSSDNDILYIQTDRGKLSTLKIQLEQGRGQFSIQSVPETILANILVYDPNNQIESGHFTIQFA